MKPYFYAKKSLALNITPLIDILFVIVIFFSVGTEFTSTRGINLVLPESETADGIGDVENLIITVDGNETMYIDEKAISISELEDALRDGRYLPSAPVSLNIDRRATHGLTIRIMDILKMNGFQTVHFLSREK